MTSKKIKIDWHKTDSEKPPPQPQIKQDQNDSEVDKPRGENMEEQVDDDENKEIKQEENGNGIKLEETSGVATIGEEIESSTNREEDNIDVFQDLFAN